MYKDVPCSVPNNEKLKSPVCPLMREWLQTFWHINTMECYTVGKTNVSTWLNFKNNVEQKKEATEDNMQFKT